MHSLAGYLEDILGQLTQPEELHWPPRRNLVVSFSCQLGAIHLIFKGNASCFWHELDIDVTCLHKADIFINPGVYTIWGYAKRVRTRQAALLSFH